MLLNKIKRELKFLLPKKVVHSWVYLKNKKEKLNWENPMLYDEKIHWLMVYLYDSSYGRYADKYLVREYVKECGLEHLLIPMLGIYEDASKIEYDKLPNKFILKATHGSGEEFYEICSDKLQIDRAQVQKKMNKALKDKFYKHRCEYQYEKIRPRIICEKLLEEEECKKLSDYKVICTNGKAVAILVCTNRDEGRDYYSIDWEYLEYVKENYRSKELIEKPNLLKEMIGAAEILASSFPLARIDFYMVDNKLYFGEITLTPSAGNHVNLNETGQRKLGEAVCLPRL